MKRHIAYLAVVLLVAASVRSYGDYAFTEGSGKTAFAFTCFTSKVCGTATLVNSAGAEAGVAALPLQVSLANTAANGTAVLTTGTGGTFPATQSGTWTVQPGNTANTTAWLVTGTGGTFPVTNTGTFAVQATLAAETTKVIGTVNQGTSPWVVSGTVTANLGTIGTAATAANQATEISSLATIASNTGTYVAAVSKVQSSAAEANHVIKASAGDLISISGSAASGSYIMLVDATTAPTAGGAAIAPVKCWGPMAAAGPFAFGWGVGPVLHFSTGIVVVSSSTGCFTNTAVNAAFLAAEFN